MQYHKYSLWEIENMIPWERDIYVTLLQQHLEEEVWTAGDVTKKEMNDFLESMNSSQFKDIEKFFETMPKLSHTIKVTNPVTEIESEVVLEGLASFFA